jgi:hypothetical protein
MSETVLGITKNYFNTSLTCLAAVQVARALKWASGLGFITKLIMPVVLVP